MASDCTKSGWLRKAGKHTYQPWRNRWFLLEDSCLKYYNTTPEFDDSKLLGTIQRDDIQSVQQYKEKKHCFIINTKGRTYYVAAKSDLERDEWISSMRNRPTLKRQLTDGTEFPNISTKISSFKNNDNDNNTTTTNNNNNSINSNNDINNNNEEDPLDTNRVENDIQIPSEIPIYAKVVRKGSGPAVAPRKGTSSRLQRSHTLPPIHEDATTRKGITRSLTEGDNPAAELHDPTKVSKVFNQLHRMSVIDEATENTEDAGYTLEEYDDNHNDDDDDDDDDNDDQKQFPFSLPQPRENNETYAFDEIKKIAEKTGQVDLEVDLTEIAKLCKLDLDEKEKYPAMALLSTYLKEKS